MADAGAVPPIRGSPDATWRDELRALTRLATPIVGANLLQMAVTSIDVLFVARLGAGDFAAATFGVFLFSITLWSIGSMVAASSPIIAAERGRRRHAVREVRRTFRMSLWLAVAACLPFLVLLGRGQWLLRLAGQDTAVAARAGAFLVVLRWALLPAVAATAMRTATAALDRPGWTLFVSAMAVGVSALTNWLFVYGHGGFPAMGLEGSALASVVTLTAAMVAYCAILAFDRRLRRYRLFGRWWRPEWSRLGEVARLGFPIALAVMFEGGLFGGAGLLMGLIGVEAVAAHAIAINIASLTFQVPLGIAQAATIRVGLAFGAADLAAITRAGRVALAVGIGVMGLAATGIWLLPRPLIAAYIDPDLPANARVVALALRLLVVAAVSQLLDGAQAVSGGILRGLQDTRVPMFIALFGYWGVGFGAAALLGFRLGLGAVGVWCGMAVGLAMVTALFGLRWRRREQLGLLPDRGRSVAKAGTGSVPPSHAVTLSGFTAAGADEREQAR